MPIYTRTGDKGQTSLFNGQRVSKADLRVEAYGTVDELSSAIGVAIAEVQSSILRLRSGQEFKVQSYLAKRDLASQDNSKLKSELVRIQNDLFEIGSTLASPGIKNYESGIRNLKKRVKGFEDSIDSMTEELPPLANFILPGGGRVGSLIHFARTVARRAERRAVALSKSEKVEGNIIMYLNRLSDLLFTMARFINCKEKQKEIIWRKG